MKTKICKCGALKDRHPIIMLTDDYGDVGCKKFEAKDMAESYPGVPNSGYAMLDPKNHSHPGVSSKPSTVFNSSGSDNSPQEDSLKKNSAVVYKPEDTLSSKIWDEGLTEYIAVKHIKEFIKKLKEDKYKIAHFNKDGTKIEGFYIKISIEEFDKLAGEELC